MSFRQVPTRTFSLPATVTTKRLPTSLQSAVIPSQVTTAPLALKFWCVLPAPTEDRAVRLAAMGDTRSGDSGQIQLGSALCHIDEGRPLDGIILLGDNLSFYGEAEHITDHFEKPYASLLRNGVQFFAVLGNHDVKKGFEAFQLNYPYFNMNGRHYHARVFGDNLVQCIFLDSTTILTDLRQQSWLQKTLLDSTSTWKLVALHHPLYGRTKRRPEPEWEYRDLLEPILLEGKVDIVVNGHNHLYMRLKPQKGIHHFTAGSGGELESGVLLEDDPDLVVGLRQNNCSTGFAVHRRKV